MAAWRYEFYLLVLKKSHSFAALTREIFSTLEDKICISTRPCNILYVEAEKPASFSFNLIFRYNYGSC